MNPHEILAEVKDAVRRPIVWPGGYNKRVLLSDGHPICMECVRDEWRNIVAATLYQDRNGWAAIGVDVLWEGPAEHCAQCAKELPTEYGDPDPGENE
jgi:hypothetical protein